MTTDLHRVYIQTLLSRRVMREEVGLELYRRAIKAVRAHDDAFRPTHAADVQGFGAFIGQLGVLLHDFGLEIKQGREDTGKGKGWIALVNARPDKDEPASDYTPPELTYFRTLVTEIIESYPENSIGLMKALRIAGEQEAKMTKVAAEALLGTFVSRGWLARSKRGRYSLAPRGTFELETWLEKEFEDFMHRCFKCNKLVLAGLACATEGCPAHIHGYCYDIHVRRSSTGDTCPTCKSSWAQLPPKPVGENAAPRNEDEWRGTKKRRRSGRTQRGDEEENDEEDDNDDDLNELEEQEDGPSQSQSRRLTQMTQNEAGPSRRNAQRESRGRPSTVVPETQYDDDEE